MSDGPEWFAPKRFGFGAGLPIAWQGWVATGLFVGAIAAASLLLRHHVAAYASVIVTATILFTVVRRARPKADGTGAGAARANRRALRVI